MGTDYAYRTYEPVVIETQDASGDWQHAHRIGCKQARGAGSLMLDAAAVRDLCGDPRDFPRLEWDRRDIYQGRLLPVGMIVPAAPPLSNYDALRMSPAAMVAYAAACAPVAGNLPAFEPFPVKRGRGRPAKAVAAVEASVAPPEAPVAFPEAPVAPTGDLSAVLARLARLEAHVGLVARPRRSEAHANAIRRAWAMRSAMRERADLDRRALLASNAANGELRTQLVEAKSLEREMASSLVDVERARAAAVHRAACDEARAIDAETAVALMTAERDDALSLAAAEETRAIGADRAATALRRAYGDLQGRADRLARIAVQHRRDVRHARDDVKRAQLDVVMIRKSERQALKRFDALRAAVDSSPAAAKVIDREIERRMAA